MYQFWAGEKKQQQQQKKTLSVTLMIGDFFLPLSSSKQILKTADWWHFHILPKINIWHFMQIVF